VNGYQQVTLESLNSGAVLDLFEDAWRKVINNINDPNTKPDAVRKVKIEIAVRPSADRRNASTSVSVIPTLAAVVPHKASIFIDITAEGKVHAYTFDPKQQSLDFKEKEEVIRTFPSSEEKEAK
jgi:hypothetical protein